MRNRFVQFIAALILALTFYATTSNAAPLQKPRDLNNLVSDQHNGNSQTILLVATPTPIPSASHTFAVVKKRAVYELTVNVNKYLQSEMYQYGLSMPKLAEQICKSSGDARPNCSEVRGNWLKTISSGTKPYFTALDINLLVDGLLYTLPEYQQQRKRELLLWELSRKAGIDPIPSSPLKDDIDRLVEAWDTNTTSTPTMDIATLIHQQMRVVGLENFSQLADKICSATQDESHTCFSSTHNWLKTISSNSKKKPLRHDEVNRIISGLVYDLPVRQQKLKRDLLLWKLKRSAGLDPIAGSPLEADIDRLVEAWKSDSSSTAAYTGDDSTSTTVSNSPPSEEADDISAASTSDTIQQSATNVDQQTEPLHVPPLQAPSLPLPGTLVTTTVTTDAPPEVALPGTPQPVTEVAVPTKPLTVVPPEAGQNVYVVQPGDTLNRIATRFYGIATLWPRIYEDNAQIIGSNPDLIRPGQRLTVDWLLVPLPQVPPLVAPAVIEAPKELDPLRRIDIQPQWEFGVAPLSSPQLYEQPVIQVPTEPLVASSIAEITADATIPASNWPQSGVNQPTSRSEVPVSIATSPISILIPNSQDWP